MLQGQMLQGGRHRHGLENYAPLMLLRVGKAAATMVAAPGPPCLRPCIASLPPPGLLQQWVGMVVVPCRPPPHLASLPPPGPLRQRTERAASAPPLHSPPPPPDQGRARPPSAAPHLRPGASETAQEQPGAHHVHAAPLRRGPAQTGAHHVHAAPLRRGLTQVAAALGAGLRRVSRMPLLAAGIMYWPS